MNVARRETLRLIDGGGGEPPGGPPPGGGAPEDWRHLLAYARDGKSLVCSYNNLLVLLRHWEPLKGLFEYDEFANVIRYTRTPPWRTGGVEFQETDVVELAGLLGQPDTWALNVGEDRLINSVAAVARDLTVHPIRDWLTALEWDGTPRVERLFVDWFGALDRDYNRRAAQCFLASAVAKILFKDPQVPYLSAKVDFMVVLEGSQGQGKTSALMDLFGARYYTESAESPDNKDFYQMLPGHWAIEVGELVGFGKATAAAWKQVLTKRFDTYRPSYGRTAKQFPRSCIFVGTSNDDQYLRDPTGGRRFLPVEVGKVDGAGIPEARDQLWAEAVHLYRSGFDFWNFHDDARLEQDARYQEDSWREPIERWLAGKCDSDCYPSRISLWRDNIEWVTLHEVMLHALHIETGRQGKAEQNRAADVLRRLGWIRGKRRVNGVPMARWDNPDYRDEPMGGNDAVPF